MGQSCPSRGDVGRSDGCGRILRAMPQQESPRISGTVVRNNLAELRERYPVEVESALLELDPAARTEVAQALSIGWVDIGAYEEFYKRVARAVGRPLADLHMAVSRVSVQKTLTTVHRLLMRFTTDQALVSRTPLIYSKTFDRGALRPSISEPGRAEIEVVGWPGMPEFALRGLRVGVETVLVVAGRKDVRVTGRQAPDGARLMATWTVR
jgi:hypothetical protein